MSKSNILLYLLRRDMRISDNPILHHVASTKHDFTHMLPVYIFPAQQIEVSGFIKDGSDSPYPQARSTVGEYWRCGPHRAKIIGHAVWDVKTSLESIGSGLAIRMGMVGDVVDQLLEGFRSNNEKVGGVWMIGEEGVEEKRDEKTVSTACERHGVPFKLWVDEKYFIDDRDLNFSDPKDLPDVFTTYRKSVEPLREKPRPALPRPEPSTVPPMPNPSSIPSQRGPFVVPTSYKDLEESLLKPVNGYMDNIPPFPDNAVSTHPFQGGESVALARLEYLVKSGIMADYKETRNGLIGVDFSTKLSAHLAQGSITARQVHEALVAYEDGTNPEYQEAKGYGGGENEGTKAVRFELLWRDYMRLCTRKFKHRLFRQDGFRDGDAAKEGEKRTQWRTARPRDGNSNGNGNGDAAASEQQQQRSASAEDVAQIIARFNAGTTGMGLIDASQRELIHTGYTSNRARQNVASFLAKHLGIDWRYGAEWYEMMLVDYDVCSNWANWQYVAGVGNDPRGEARIFNPVKQAFDYDKEGRYVRMWVPEVRRLERLENVFQAWTASAEDLEAAGLTGNLMVTDPIKRIEFSVEGKPRTSRRPFVRRHGGNSGGGGGRQIENADADARGKERQVDSGSSAGKKENPRPPGGIPTGPRGPSRGERGGGRGGGRGGYRGWGFTGERGGYRGRSSGPPGGAAAGPSRAHWTLPGHPIG